MVHRVDVLRKTKELLLVGGWVQGADTDDQGGRCLGRAVVDALYGVSLDDAAKSDLLRQTGCWRIPAWNDRSGRTLDEVIDLIDQVLIEDAEAVRVTGFAAQSG